MQDFCCLIGNFGDNSWLLWEGIRLKYGLYTTDYFGIYGYNLNYFKNLTEPLLYLPFIFFSKYINVYFVWNFYIILFLFLSGLFSYIYLKKLTTKFNAALLSVLWLASPYFSIQSRDHLSLLAAFLYPIFLIINRPTTFKQLFFKYMFLVILPFISIYISVFIIFLNFFINSFDLFFNRKKVIIIDFTLSILLIFSLSISFKTFFPDQSRNIDNFLIFSYKPWHSLDKPNNSLINSIDPFENFQIKGNILFNYFEFEHATGYFGVIFLILTSFSLVKYYKILDKRVVFILFISIITSLPPLVTIKGIDIYLPSYLFYLLFDQFRVLSRINIFSFFLMIVIIIPLLDSKYFRSKITILTLITLMILEIFFPFKISEIKPLDTNFYKKILENTSSESYIIVYPYDNDINFYKEMQFLPRKIFNPDNYRYNSDLKFSSEDFTKNLTCDEIAKYSSKSDLYLLQVKSKSKELPKDIKLKQIEDTSNLALFKIECFN